MKKVCHSVHEPRCGVCGRHSATLESVREHLRDGKCTASFSTRGCSLCLQIFEDGNRLEQHKIECLRSDCENRSGEVLKAVAIDCQMVVGTLADGSSVEQCASVCLVDAEERQLLFQYVRPQHAVSDYRHDVTGITDADLNNGVSLEDVRNQVRTILGVGDSGKLLVGHDLRHDMSRLQLQYPRPLMRDTAHYVPLLNTNLVSHALKDLTSSVLGYQIQAEKRNKPFENCVASMRLYKRMRNQQHGHEGAGKGLASYTPRQLANMSVEQLYTNSVPNYYCWCRDRHRFNNP